MRFVSPETVRITLKNGVDWIEIAKELTVGEDKRYRAKAFKRINQGALVGEQSEISVDFAVMALERVNVYLKDWSAKKPDGKDLPVTREAIDAMAVEDFEEIDAAIQKHMAETAEEKKQKPGPTPLTVPAA